MELSETSGRVGQINPSDMKKGSSTSTTATGTTTSSSLLYLEDIHIFGLANMLQRPIIVIALEKIQNIQPIHLRGIYLPLLAENAAACVKDPIVIAFHRYHFVPLVFAMDNESSTRANDANRTLTYTSKYFDFENVDRDVVSNETTSTRYQEDDKVSRAPVIITFNKQTQQTNKIKYLKL